LLKLLELTKEGVWVWIRVNQNIWETILHDFTSSYVQGMREGIEELKIKLMEVQIERENHQNIKMLQLLIEKLNFQPPQMKLKLHSP